MLGGVPGNPLVFVEFEEGGGVFEVAALSLGTRTLNTVGAISSIASVAPEPE